MFERIKQNWDKIVYMALGFFVLFYIGFYFSSFSSEPVEQKTKQIVVIEKMNNPSENITEFDENDNYNIVDSANTMMINPERSIHENNRGEDNEDEMNEEERNEEERNGNDRNNSNGESIDRTVEDILSQVHKEGDMCKELKDNTERKMYCNQLDHDTCKQKSCCVSLYDKNSVPQSCTVGDEGGPTYAQTKSMRFYSFMQEPKQEI